LGEIWSLFFGAWDLEDPLPLAEGKTRRKRKRRSGELATTAMKQVQHKLGSRTGKLESWYAYCVSSSSLF
jgi:hypothetical protein